jgi:hypothetical protein
MSNASGCAACGEGKVAACLLRRRVSKAAIVNRTRAELDRITTAAPDPVSRPRLALLLIRVAKRRTGQTWRQINRELGRLHAITLSRPPGPSSRPPNRGRRSNREVSGGHALTSGDAVPF